MFQLELLDGSTSSLVATDYHRQTTLINDNGFQHSTTPKKGVAVSVVCWLRVYYMPTILILFVHIMNPIYL